MKNHPIKQELRASAQSALRSCLLFNTLDDEALSSLIDKLSFASLSNNEVLFKHGDMARCFYLVESGKLKLSRYSQSGREKIIEFISPGESFAEALMFSKKAEFPVTATALEMSQVWCVDSKHYSELLRNSPDACFAVMGEMSRRLHAQLTEIDNLALHSATLRLVGFLLNESAGVDQITPTLNLGVSNVVLASRLSIRPETLSRIFAKLTSEGLISIEERHVELLDLVSLKNILLSD